MHLSMTNSCPDMRVLNLTPNKKVKVSGCIHRWRQANRRKCVVCVKQKTIGQNDGRYSVKDEALIGSIIRHIVDLVFPSKPWAPSVHLVRVGLVTSENLGGRGQERGEGVAEWLTVDLGMGGGGFGERVFKI